MSLRFTLHLEDMTRGAYELCGAMPGDDDVDGDGMTPLFSAIALDSADAWWVDFEVS